MFSFSSPSAISQTANSFFSAYASLAGTIMLFRSMANDLIPPQLMSYLTALFNYFFTPPSSSNQVTLIIEEEAGMEQNEIFDAAEIYLNTLISPDIERIKISKTSDQKNITLSIEKGQVTTDYFEKITLKWRYVEEKKHDSDRYLTEFFELTFDKKFRDTVTKSYLPYVIERADAIEMEDKVVQLYSLDYRSWSSIDLKHPSTFETLAMDTSTKKMIVDDLDRFLRRKEFYWRVGKAWKRGYLLYGPPGTGKSSLIAAMANYLNFDIYDLQLSGVYDNSKLRTILLGVSNRSILVIEDIDCSCKVLDRESKNDDDEDDEESPSNSKLTLSGILNFADGLWSSCGNERIIVFTTNHKERLDPALLRPGRMDVHIHMSYCTVEGFRILLSNYLGSSGADHPSCGEIEELIASVEVTPAEIAEKLMREDDVEIVIQGLLEFLKDKRSKSLKPPQNVAKECDAKIDDDEKQTSCTTTME